MQWYDPRFGRVNPPDCSGASAGRLTLSTDWGRGTKHTATWQSGIVIPLLRAILTIKEWREGESKDPYNVLFCGEEACRDKRTANDPSMHCFPLAIDLNCNTNSLGGGRGDMPDRIIRAFEDEGFAWGGDWGDPMHFEHTHWFAKWVGHTPPTPEPTFRELVMVRVDSDRKDRPRPFKTTDAAVPYLEAVIRARWDRTKLSPDQRKLTVRLRSGGPAKPFALVSKAVERAKALLDPKAGDVLASGDKEVADIGLFRKDTGKLIDRFHMALRRQRV